jgi:hypothetical protein
VFLVNSRLGLVSAAPSSSGREVPHPTGAPLLPKLRGQFAEFLDQGSLDRLGILYLPTCVGLGYGHLNHSLEVFLGSVGSVASPQAARHQVSGLTAPRICLRDLPTPLPQDDHRLGRPTLLRLPIGCLLPSGSVDPPRWRVSLSSSDSALARLRWYRNINRSSIAYASRPRLRARLTLGG